MFRRVWANPGRPRSSRKEPTLETKTLVRSASSGNFGAVEAEWDRIVQSPDATAEQVLELLPAIEELAKQSSDDRLETMLWSGIEELREAWGAASCLTIAAPILLKLPKSANLRDQVLALYKEAHGQTEGFDALLEEAGLAGSKPPRRALRTLELGMAVDKGSFLIPREEGPAVQVQSVDRTTWQITIKSSKSESTSSATELADSYQVAAEDDFRVLHSLFPDRFQALLKDDPASLVISILKSRSKPISVENLGSLLSPTYIKAGDWKDWWSKARTALKKCSNVRMEGRSPIMLSFDAQGSSPEKEAETTFNKAKGLTERWMVYEDYIRQSKLLKTSPDRDLLQKFAAEFRRMAELLRQQKARTAFEAWLMVREIEKAYGAESLDDHAAQMLAAAKEPAHLFDSLETLSLWGPACEVLRQARANDGAEVLARMLPGAAFPVCDTLAKCLADWGYGQAEFNDIVQSILAEPRKHSDALFWVWDGPGVNLVPVPDRKGLLLRVLRLLADVQRRDDVSSETLKRIRARARTVMAARNFERVRETVGEIDPAVGATLKTTVKQLSGLGQAVQEDLLNTLREYFPDAAKGPAAPLWKRDEVLLCTSQGLSKREAELSELVNVKMRQNAIAIGEAASHGDLSENSEYKFALEERDLLRARVAQIQNELSMAKVLDPQEISTAEITPGCKTRIRKTDDGNTMELMLLGPWEANVEKGVYNYKSPIGQALLGLHLGEKANLNIGMLVGQYEVLSIERGID